MMLELDGNTGVSLLQDNTVTTSKIVGGAVTPDKSSGFPVVKEYTSPEQAITAGSSFSLAHGLGVVPKFALAQLNCKTSEFGFSAGESVQYNLSAFEADTNLDRGIVLYYDATNLKCRIIIVVVVGPDGVRRTLTAANWRIVVRAYA